VQPITTTDDSRNDVPTPPVHPSLVRLVVAHRFAIIDEARCWHCGTSLRECAATLPDRVCCVPPDSPEGYCHHHADFALAAVLLDEIASGTVAPVEGAGERTTPHGWPRYQDLVPWSWNGRLDPPGPLDGSVTAELVRLVIDGQPHPYPCGCWYRNLRDTLTDIGRDHDTRRQAGPSSTAETPRRVRCPEHPNAWCVPHQLPPPCPAIPPLGDPDTEQMRADLHRLRGMVTELQTALDRMVADRGLPTATA
jgi:hypothetical protein